MPNGGLVREYHPQMSLIQVYLTLSLRSLHRKQTSSAGTGGFCISDTQWAKKTVRKGSDYIQYTVFYV